MKFYSLSLLAAICIWTARAQQPSAVPVYLDDSQPIEKRIDDALSRMTTEEKVAICHAQSKFSSAGVKRLGIPEVWTSDGPHGIRPEVQWDKWSQAGWTNDSCVAFPALTCLAATWNPAMSLAYGHAIGEEARYRNKSVLLGPGVNICRTPLNGRNFEYMGEDPYLSSKMVVPYVQGVQSNGVASCVKHYALNNQEINRHYTNVIVDERALYEIYLPAFKAAVTEGNTWTIMGSYNLYRNQHACTNQYLLNDILKGEWQFDGAVVSDWGGVHETDQAITNGMDMEFGSWTDGLHHSKNHAYENYFLANPYLKKLASGEADIATLNDKARRVLRLIFRTAMNRNRPYGSLCSDEHYATARQIGNEGIVLLKNNGHLLPIQLSDTRKILVVGENAIKMMTVGGGSSSLKAQHEISPLQGIQDLVGSQAEVVYARGYIGDTNGNYNGVTTGQNLSDKRTARQLADEAIAAARQADIVIFFGGLNKSKHQDCEDADRLSLQLPYGQDSLITALQEANSHLVVVNISGSGVAMPWVKKVPAILQAWYLGSEAGHSIADILFGKCNPSGKLPVTFPARLEDVGAHALGEYPGVERTDGSQIFDEKYNEGIYVGYRWFDKQHIAPLFAFGHGLSYTTFRFGKATANKKSMTTDSDITFSIDVTNTGKCAGAEVVQLYISDKKCSVDRPEKELKGFQKIHLAPGETKTVQLTINKDALSFFDTQSHQWIAEPGTFTAHIGAASNDIKSSIDFILE